jgi:hypothetical protein
MMVSVAVLGCLLLFSGCESSESNTSGNSQFVGTWALYENGTGSIYWYIHFFDNGDWNISNNADGSGRRAFGTYVVSGDTARGPMENPGTGTGEIVATVSGGAMNLDFIEHWHNPYKVLKFTGVKL